VLVGIIGQALYNMFKDLISEYLSSIPAYEVDFIAALPALGVVLLGYSIARYWDKSTKKTREKKDKLPTVLFGAGLVFALLAAVMMYWAWIDLATSTTKAEFFVSTGFLFIFGTVSTISTGISEFRAEKRMKELRLLAQRPSPNTQVETPA
jgi:fluoride ion exporter CrcB/FEX